VSALTISEAKTHYDIEEMSGWQSCSKCAADPSDSSPALATYYMKQNVASPSQDSDATEFHIGGSAPYANVLFSKRLEGDATVIRQAHHFTYEMNFYYKNASAVQALEFDINQMIDGKRFIWGTQCNVRAGAVWDIWDNVNHKWVHTGASCTAPPTYKWNKVVLEMERTSDNKLRYVSITLNGTKRYLNRYYSPTGTSWTGMTMNFQLDGNARMDDYSVWVDNFKLNWW
jgi:hypothetical protein